MLNYYLKANISTDNMANQHDKDLLDDHLVENEPPPPSRESLYLKGVAYLLTMFVGNFAALYKMRPNHGNDPLDIVAFQVGVAALSIVGVALFVGAINATEKYDKRKYGNAELFFQVIKGGIVFWLVIMGGFVLFFIARHLFF